MAAKSFKQMVSTKEIRRADAYKVRLEDLHEEPGLNWRRYTDAFHKSVEELAELIAGGMEVDPLEVRPREEGGVWIVTGHRRTRAWRLLDLSGRLQRDPKTGEFLVSVVPSKAKDAPAPGARKHQPGPVRTDPSRLRRRLSPDA